MQLHGTARHCRLLCQSLRALKSCATLAPSPPHSRRVMAGHVGGGSWGEQIRHTASPVTWQGPKFPRGAPEEEPRALGGVMASGVENQLG
eukprot:scaffold38560_cov42-Phaeocystis_antarctica.AAC.1